MPKKLVKPKRLNLIKVSQSPDLTEIQKEYKAYINMAVKSINKNNKHNITIKVKYITKQDVEISINKNIDSDYNLENACTYLNGFVTCYEILFNESLVPFQLSKVEITTRTITTYIEE